MQDDAVAPLRCGAGFGAVVVAGRERRAEWISRERKIALSIAHLPRGERMARWTELTGLSEKALYRRLAA